jgi:hypothetical protein
MTSAKTVAGLKKYKITIEQVQEDDEPLQKDDNKNPTTTMVSTTVMGPPGLLDWVRFSARGASTLTTESTVKIPIAVANEEPKPITIVPPTVSIDIHETSQHEQQQRQRVSKDHDIDLPVRARAAAAAIIQQEEPKDLLSLPWWERRQFEVRREQQEKKAKSMMAMKDQVNEPNEYPATAAATTSAIQPSLPSDPVVSPPPSKSQELPLSSSLSPTVQPIHETTTTLTRRDGSMEIRTIRLLDPNQSTNHDNTSPPTFVSETRYRELTAEGVLVRESVTRKDVQGRDRVVWERKWGRHHRTIPLEHRAAAEAEASTVVPMPVPVPSPSEAADPLVHNHSQYRQHRQQQQQQQQQQRQEGPSSTISDQPMDQIRHHLTWSERRRALNELREQQQQQQQAHQLPQDQEQDHSNGRHRWREWRERAYHRQQQQQQHQEELEEQDQDQDRSRSRWSRNRHHYRQRRQEEQQKEQDPSASNESFEERSWPPKAYLRRQQQQHQEDENFPRHNV